MDRLYTRRELLQMAAVGTVALGMELPVEADQTDTPLPQRTLGKTGVRVPILGYGTAPTGMRRELKDAIALYNEAIDLGVNYMDTAPEHTGYGKAQEQLGYVLKERRKEVFLVTKCYEARGDDALKLLEKNLKELQTDHADLVYAHSLGELNLNVALSKDGVLPALLKAKRDGLTRFVGISGHHRPHKFLTALEAFEIDVMMNAVNFADRHTYNFEEKVWPTAARKKVGLVAMKVFGGAQRAGGASNSMMPADYLQLALRYALSVPNVSLAVVGMGTREELRRNLAWAKRFKRLNDEERREVAALGRELAEKWGAHFGAVS